MKIKLAASILFLFFVLVNCRQTKEFMPPERVRSLSPREVSTYHNAIQMTIAWVPYKDQKLVKNKKGDWHIVKSDGEQRQGNIPVILVTYPESSDTIWIDMNTDSKLLGQLVKHSLMTQEPIQRPYTQFFEVASCQNCHPPEVKVEFN